MKQLNLSEIGVRALLLALFAVCAVKITFAQNNAMPTTTPPAKVEKAILGGGCFWCTEAIFQTAKGVKSVVSGYAGGKIKNPTYEQVCSGTTGHAEVIEVTFDPAQISYAEVLKLFWKAHDPTTLNRQGADTGTQYRSIILYTDEAQKLAAEKSKKEAQADFKDKIVTEITPLTEFYPAEKYHQDFYNRNKNYPYCAVVIAPKLKKLEKK